MFLWGTDDSAVKESLTAESKRRFSKHRLENLDVYLPILQVALAELADAEHKTALVFVREVGAIDNITYRQLNGCSARQASADLKKLQALDLFSPQGNNRSTYYIPSQRFLELKHTTLGADSVCSDAKVACLNSKVACLDDITCNLSTDLKERISNIDKKYCRE